MSAIVESEITLDLTILRRTSFPKQAKEWFERHRLMRHPKTNDESFERMNNYRFANPSVPEEVALYKTQQQNGCCGFVDDVMRDRQTGKLMMIGFNYGH